MNTRLDTSSEFASLVNQLHGSPYDPALKQAVVNRLPEMKALAQQDPFILYRLAQVYPKNSSQYLDMMTQAADLGCTNAMLAVCEVSLKSGHPMDIKKAAHYMVLIEQSNDSYIKQHSGALLEQFPRLAEQMSKVRSNNLSQYTPRFFADLKTEDAKEWGTQNSYPIIGH